MTASPLSGERIPLPEGLTRLSDGSLRADGVDGVAVIGPAAGAGSRPVSVDVGLQVLQALGGAHLPAAGSTAPTTQATQATQAMRATPVRRSGLRSMTTGEVSDGVVDIVPAGPGDETTLLKPVSPVSAVADPPRGTGPTGLGDGRVGAGGESLAGRTQESAQEPAARALEASEAPGGGSPGLLETGVWEEPDESGADAWDGDAGSSGDTDGLVRLPSYPEPRPGSGRRRRGAHRARTAPSASSAGQPTADTPTAPDNSKSKQPQPVRAPQPLDALPDTEIVSASEAALIAAPPVRASICPQGHANPPEIRECLICSQPLTGVFSYVHRPALSTLTLSTGAAVEVAGDVVVGRAPQVQAGADPHVVALVMVPSPHHMVSRSHLLLTTSGWSVLAQDLGSSNGTVLARPGATPVLLGPGMPTPVFMGDLMDVGDGVTLRIDPPAWLRQQRA